MSTDTDVLSVRRIGLIGIHGGLVPDAVNLETVTSDYISHKARRHFLTDISLNNG